MDLYNIVIKPITTEEEFQEANSIIEKLIDVDLIEDIDERKKALAILEAVTIQAYEYEKKHYSIPKANPIEAIKERIYQLNLL